jgi:Ca2+-binding RTX toxin-like protein
MGSGSDTLLGFENLTGSSFNDTLTGNASANGLNGGLGADTLIGGDGSDTYTVDNVGDIVRETNAVAGTGGIDIVNSSITYTLGANVENLTLIGTAAINGTGNALANMIIGNTGANILNGGNGNDLLTGGAGIDHFQFTTALGVANVDTITDFVSGTEKIDLSKTIFTAFSGLAVGSTLANTEIGNHIRYTAATGVLSYDADGSAGAGAAVQIALVGTISHPASLLGTDFYMTA